MSSTRVIGRGKVRRSHPGIIIRRRALDVSHVGGQVDRGSIAFQRTSHYKLTFNNLLRPFLRVGGLVVSRGMWSDQGWSDPISIFGGTDVSVGTLGCAAHTSNPF